MNQQLFTLSLLEIFLFIVIAVVIFYVSYSMLRLLFFKSVNLKGDNLAFSIFTAGNILSTGMILSEILPSITNMLRLSAQQDSEIALSTIVQYSSLYLLIGFLSAVIINASVFLLFSVLTRGINEFQAIKENNLAVSIVVVSTLVSITLIVKESIALLVGSLIPYPQVTNFL